MLDDKLESLPDDQPAARVLIVEDDPLQQKIAAMHVARLGIGVDIASDGLQAVQATAAFSYMFVLMDCQMPLLDGCQAATRIRQRELVTSRHVPIIGYSAHAKPEECIRAGMDDFIQKPCPASTMKDLVERYTPDVLRIHT